jgi:type II secretory pathway pseudopilin PulG
MRLSSRRSAARLPGAPLIHAARRRLDAVRGGSGAGERDGGFVLLESMIAITVVTIVMGALATFFVNGIGSSNQLRARAQAAQLADTAIESIRSLQPSDLVSGRDLASVQTQFSSASRTVKDWLDPMTAVYDSTVTSGGSTANLPTVPVSQTPNKVTYQVSKYLGKCATVASGSDGTCDKANLSTGIPYLRAVVAVTWTDRSCPENTCTFLSATLINTASDVAFNLNQVPTPAPTIVAPGNQSTIVRQPVNLQLTVQDGTGVPSVTWSITAGSLPAGLTLDPASGAVSGTPTATVTNRSVTITVTDAFLRTSSTTFTWSVVPDVSITGGADKTWTTGTTIPTFTLTASGGTGAPYSWSDPNSTLPAGLLLNPSTGQITGRPTTPGVYAVTIRVTDSGGHPATTTMIWSVYDPLAAPNPGNQASIVSTPITPLTVAVTGGSGSYAWTRTGSLPAGITFNNGTFTGTPTTQGTSTITLSVRDTVTGNVVGPFSFTWAIVPPLVLSGGNDQISSVGTAITALTLGATGGGGSPYTWSDPNGTLPDGLNLATVTSGFPTTYQGRVTGTPTTPGTYAVQLLVTDSKGVTAWTSFTWTVYPALTVSSPGSQTDTVSTTITPLAISASGGSGSFTWTASSLPAGLSLSSSGVVSGTPTTTATYSPTITVTDRVTGVVKSTTFTWSVVARPTVTSPGAQRSTTTGTVSLQLTTSCLNSPCTYTLNNGPAGLSVSSTGRITGTVTSGVSTFNAVSVTVTDAAGVSATSATFTWTIVGKPSVSTPAAQIDTSTGSVSVPVSGTCPNSPCTYTLNNGPSGLSIPSSTITGTITSGAQTFNSVSVTIRDASGVTATSGSFTWLVNAAPTMTNPGNQVVYRGSATTLDVSALVDGGTGPLTYSATNLPSWLSINASTGLISGTAPTTLGVTSNITVKATDADGVSVTSAAFSWRVTNLQLALGDTTVYKQSSFSLDLDSVTTGGTSPYSFTITNRPSWLSYNSSTHVLSGTAPNTNSTTYGNIVFSVTDSAGVTITNPPIDFHVTNLRWTSTFSNRSNTRNVTITSLNISTSRTGGVTPIVYTASGLPTGLTINSSTGVVSGRPTVSGSYTVQFTATDDDGSSVSTNTFTWTIS